MRPIICSGIAIYRNSIKQPLEIIDVIESVVSNELNDTFSWVKASVIDQDGTESVSDVRTNSTIGLAVSGRDVFSSAVKHINSLLHESFIPCFNDFVLKFNIDSNAETSKNYSILKYENNEQYIYHLDDSSAIPRKVSAVGYLNDDFSGGELDFDKLPFRYFPVAGDIVIFPSIEPYSHASLPISDGVKYSVVNWWS